MKTRVPVIMAAVVVTAGVLALKFCRDDEPVAQTQPKKKPAAVRRDHPSVTASPVIASKPPADKPPAKAPLPPPPLTPEEEEKKSVRMATTMHRWMTPIALDHDGNFPPDLSALLDAGVGFPVEDTAEWFSRVIEYRGRKLSHRDPSNRLLMRYRINGVPDKEVRLFVGGTTEVHLSTDPIPEDAPVENVPDEPR